MREPDVLKECWETLKRKISPIPNKSFPEDLFETHGQYLISMHIVYLFCVLLWAFLIYFILTKRTHWGRLL